MRSRLMNRRRLGQKWASGIMTEIKDVFWRNHKQILSYEYKTDLEDVLTSLNFFHLLLYC